MIMSLAPIVIMTQCDGDIEEGNINDSVLGNIDPDTNFLSNDTQLHTDCKYHTEKKFNLTFQKSDNFSTFHFNLRRIPQNIDKLICYLDELDLVL